MYSQIASNKRRSILYILGFILFVGGFGFLIATVLGRPNFFWPILIFAIGYALFSYFGSAKLALATSGAQPVTRDEQPQLFRVVENLSIANGTPMPAIYVIDDPSPNAFATGRDPEHAVVAATTGLLAMMDKIELEGVIAHELSHVKNFDIRFMAVVIALVTVVSFLADTMLRLSFWGGNNEEEEGGLGIAGLILGIIGAILAPIAATLLQLAISRRREFLADASGALLTRYPEGLARALEKIEAYPAGLEHTSSATAPLYISNPLKKSGSGFGQTLSAMFSTHPPVEERIQRLREMELHQ